MNNKTELKSSLGPSWRWTLNYGVGRCPIDCVYCYCKRYPWAREEFRVKTDLSKLERQMQRFQWEPGVCQQYQGQWDIMFCSSHDPFQEVEFWRALGREYILNPLSARILGMASENSEVGDHLRVLTKNGHNMDWGPEGALYGTTITTLSHGLDKILEPGAGDWLCRLAYLEMCAAEGLKVWISSEPMFVGMDLLALAESVIDFHELRPVEWWVGRFNVRGKVSDFVKECAMSDESIREQFELAKASFPEVNWFLKKEVVS